MYPYDEEWEQDLAHEEAKLEYYLSILEEEEQPFQMNDEQYEASIQHIKGELCGLLASNAHIKRSMSLLLGQLRNGPRQRKPSSKE